MISVDLRGRRVPVDSRTHTDRLNDWSGSFSYVEGARRDPGDTPMPEGETRRYLLNVPGWDGFRRVAAGTVVELAASQVGPQHDYHPEEEYPEEHEKAFTAMHLPPHASRVDEMISLARHQEVVRALTAAIEDRVAELEERMTAVEALKTEPTGLAAVSPEAKAEVKEAAKEAEPTGLAALSPEAKAEVKEAAKEAGVPLPSLDSPRRK